MVDQAGDLPGRSKFYPCSEGGVLPPPSPRLRGARGLEGYSAGATAGSFRPKLGVSVRSIRASGPSLGRFSSQLIPASMSFSHISRGIAVNTVAPGAIETDFAGGSVRDNKQV